MMFTRRPKPDIVLADSIGKTLTILALA